MSISHFSYLDALYRNYDPFTNAPFPKDSVFNQDKVRRALADLRTAIRESEGRDIPPQLNDDDLLTLIGELKLMGYHPTPLQLTHLCRGSKRVVDPKLRTLPVFGRYRGHYTQAGIRQYLEGFAQRHPEHFAADSTPKRTPKPWKNEPFFKETAFDKLEAVTYDRIQNEIGELGLSRSGDKLPAFIRNIRERYPRAFEPWTPEERALLLEAMCYTNNSARLAELFARSVKSIEGEGKRLIYRSRKDK